MAFDPTNKIVRLCLQGLELETKGNAEEAGKVFLQAWNEATDDFEKFIAAYYVTRHQKNIADKIKWIERTLQLASKINDEAVRPAFPFLYSNLAKCYAEIGDHESAKKNYDSALSSTREPTDKGPFYHGTRADLQVGDLLTAGGNSNYKSDLVMNHIYFTALVNGAGLAAALAKGDGHERVYIVEPTESFEDDPNVTNKKFPGNPTRSYRTKNPLKIVGEVSDWVKQTPEQIQQWREKLAKNKGEIIN